MKLKNKVMLITYADSMGKNLKELHTVLNTYYRDAVGGVHILPFFPSSADRGFAPMRYDVVDEAFGTYEDIEAIGREYYLMFDFMVNHISSSSKYFQDFLKRKNESKYADFFIRYEEFWGMEHRRRNSLIRFTRENQGRPILKWNFKMEQQKKSGALSVKSRLIWMSERKR